VIRRRGHRARFGDPGGSASREFRRQRRENIRAAWRPWLLSSAAVVAFAAWSMFATGVAARALAGTAGVFIGVLFVMWALGGHISAFRWWIGVEGERATAREIAKLGDEWHCEHDVVHRHGNWDHIVVGPAGMFLLDSKLLHGTAAAGGDALRAGRLVFAGGSFRAAARTVKDEVERQLGWRAPWVQAVVVVWADFPQVQHEEQNVVYVSGEELLRWLNGLPERMNRPQRAALIAALREVRDALASESTAELLNASAERVR
jgi:hypothetical protein